MTTTKAFRSAGSVFVLATVLTAASAAEPRQRIPVIYYSDLFHPHDDPDDHFDLATLFAVPELEVKAILLDLGDKQRVKPGRVVLEQMARLSGRKVPYATGLAAKLKDPKDTGRDRPADEQGAVTLLLDTLRKADRPVTVLTVGSVRELTAAYNREPELLRDKIAQVYSSIGNIGTDDLEWNVKLDPQAYIGLLRSGLPIYLLPCMAAADQHATFWQFKQQEVLEAAPGALQNFFIYALQQVRPDELDAIAALGMDLRPWRHLVWAMQRNMWSTMVFIEASGRKVYKVPGGYAALAAAPAGGEAVAVYSFVPARVEISDEVKAKFDLAPEKPNIQLSQIPDRKKYQEVMTGCLRQLLSEFPLAPEYRKK